VSLWPTATGFVKMTAFGMMTSLPSFVVTTVARACMSETLPSIPVTLMRSPDPTSGGALYLPHHMATQMETELGVVTTVSDLVFDLRARDWLIACNAYVARSVAAKHVVGTITGRRPVAVRSRTRNRSSASGSCDSVA
jgi:hypothetical protein